MNSAFLIHLSKRQAGLVVRFAAQTGRTFEEALHLLLDASIFMLHQQEVRDNRSMAEREGGAA